VEALAQASLPEENRGKYWAKKMMGVKADILKKGQVSFAHKS